MDGLIDIESARALVSDASRWSRVRDFLWNFPAQIHPTWFGRLALGPCDHWFRETLERSNAQKLPSLLSRWLAAEFDIAPAVHAFPPSDLSRLLLLDAATLESIALWIGALTSANALRRVTEAPAVRALKTALPGIYPDLFAYTAYFAKILPPSAADASPQAIRSLGFSLLFSALADLPAPLLRRLRLKLPADALPPSNDQTAEPSNGRTVKSQNHQAIKLLLKLRFPEAHALCFS